MTAIMEKAVILAAGRGTRMGSMTEALPKPMLPVGGKPMLVHILERLSAAGIRRFLIVVGYQRDAIESGLRDLAFDVAYTLQEPVNGTGSAALRARGFVGEQPFLLSFGDILCSPDEYKRAMRLLDADASGVLAVKAVDDPWQGAAVYADGGRITRIVEKPARGTSGTSWNSAGFYCFRSEVFQYLEELKPTVRKEYELTSAIHEMLADGLTLRISPIEGEWRDVGRPEDLAAVNSGM
jgi:dTDP-glucose pyrophosphorylase